MRVMGIDLETTGLETSTSRITELGYVLWETETNSPILLKGDYLYDDTYPEITEEITRLTGITRSTLTEFGTIPAQGLEGLLRLCAKHKVECCVAHNGENFDRPFLNAELNRHGCNSAEFQALPWIDTRTDLPFATEPDSRRLKHLAGDHGFLNPFDHRAVFDVLTMLRVMSHYPMEKILAYQKIPFFTMRALVTFEHKELAKGQRYSWEKIGEKTYPKQWVKRIKEHLVPAEIETCQKAGFTLVRVE